MARYAGTYKCQWDTNFPEPGLSAAISQMRQDFEEGKEKNCDELMSGLVSLVALMQVRFLFDEYNVPQAQIDGRFDEMGLRYYWRATRHEYVG